MSCGSYQGSQIQFDVYEEKDEMVAMRDTVRLATNLYRPAVNGKPLEGRFPVILERTPYHTSNHHGNSMLRATGRYFAKRGYVMVLQDVRGRGESEGEWPGLVLSTNEVNDGYDTVSWIAQQPWSDGNIGTIGLSYTGATQCALALSNPPALKAQFIMDTGYNYHTHTLRSGGAFALGILLPYAFRMAAMGKDAQRDPAVQQILIEAAKSVADMLDHLTVVPLKRGAAPLALAPAYENMLFTLATGGDYDDLWKDPVFNQEEHIDKYPDIPIFFTTSWYGHHVWATTKRFNDLRKRNKSPMRVIIGTWLHSVVGLNDTWTGEVEFGLDAMVDNLNDLRLKWFDHYLKGMHTDVLDGPPLSIFVMGGGSGQRDLMGRISHGGFWRRENNWPLDGTRFTNYYLHSGGNLSPEHPRPEGRPSSDYTFDPRDPVPTIGGGVMDTVLSPGFVAVGALDQRGRKDLKVCKDTQPLSMRPDVLVFQTPPLEEDVEVTGPIEVYLWASSSAPDTDFTAKLIDAYPRSTDYPDGFAMNLCDGIVRARYRDSREKGELMKPGQVYKFRIDLQATGNVFKTGHRIRLDISSSNYPHYDVNPNTGGPLWESDQGWQLAHQAVYHDVEHPSHIVLPIIPQDRQQA